MTKIGFIAFILLSTCGLISTAPLHIPRIRYDPPLLYSHSLPSPGETAKNEWIAPAAGFVGSAIGGRILNNVVDCHVCGKCNTELQRDTDIEERSAKIMALVQVMDEINVAKESMNTLKKITMKDAEVQFNEAVSAKINSIRDTLGNAGNYLKGAAKNILCR